MTRAIAAQLLNARRHLLEFEATLSIGTDDGRSHSTRQIEEVIRALRGIQQTISATGAERTNDHE